MQHATTSHAQLPSHAACNMQHANISPDQLPSHTACDIQHASISHAPDPLYSVRPAGSTLRVHTHPACAFCIVCSSPAHADDVLHTCRVWTSREQPTHHIRGNNGEQRPKNTHKHAYVSWPAISLFKNHNESRSRGRRREALRIKTGRERFTL